MDGYLLEKFGTVVENSLKRHIENLLSLLILNFAWTVSGNSYCSIIKIKTSLVIKYWIDIDRH